MVLSIPSPPIGTERAFDNFFFFDILFSLCVLKLIQTWSKAVLTNLCKDEDKLEKMMSAEETHRKKA